MTEEERYQEWLQAIADGLNKWINHYGLNDSNHSMNAIDNELRKRHVDKQPTSRQWHYDNDGTNVF